MSNFLRLTSVLGIWVLDLLMPSDTNLILNTLNVLIMKNSEYFPFDEQDSNTVRRMNDDYNYFLPVHDGVIGYVFEHDFFTALNTL